MPGKLPIDRARKDDQQNLSRFDLEKRQLTEKDAKLRKKAREYDDDPTKAGRPDDKTDAGTDQ